MLDGPNDTRLDLVRPKDNELDLDGLNDNELDLVGPTDTGLDKRCRVYPEANWIGRRSRLMPVKATAIDLAANTEQGHLPTPETNSLLGLSFDCRYIQIEFEFDPKLHGRELIFEEVKKLIPVLNHPLDECFKLAIT
ncbi:hypothetical protein Tsubulata_007178 [Turnera subulata]|uniref:Uncharacterized protein n=1 Tax=Turnera subulata TaxID=218843 RepID=A0A9Q0F4K1_9ROSI|nr:hypothetical protein Tsubulata_007178 [Turnera subulata]